MRTGALPALPLAAAALALAVVLAVACVTASPPDEQCITGGGVCFEIADTPGCYMPLNYPCASGYQCCTTAYGGNIRADGAIFDGPTGIPGSVDAAPNVEAGPKAEAATDAASKTTDAGVKDAETRDSHAGDAASAKDSAVDAVKTDAAES